MLETLGISDALALFIGLFWMAAGLGLIVSADAYLRVVEDLRASPGLTYVVAILAFAIGAVIVSLHRDWSGPAEVVVSLVGWGALAEGLILLARPKQFLDLVAPMARSRRMMRALGFPTQAVGALLVASALI